MKKKTAITLAALALLASGVTLGGFRVKEKKEKDKIEKALNEILLSDAKQKLYELERQDAELWDSIDYYTRVLQGLTPDTLISKSDADTLRQLVSSIYDDWKSVYSSFLNKYWDVGYAGDRFFDDEALPKPAQNKLKYLNGGMLKNYYDASWWESEYRYDDIIGQLSVDGDDHPYVHYALRRVWHMLDEIEYQNIVEQEKTVRKLEVFVNNIDNSQGVINQNTLEKMKKIVQNLFVKGNLNNKKEVERKKGAFQDAQKRVRRDESKAREKVDLLGQLTTQKKY